MSRIKFFGFLIVMLATASVSGCGGGEEKSVPENQEVLGEVFNKLIQVDTVKIEEVRNEILLTGKITYDENHLARISPISGGIVETMNVQLGDHVKKGEVLASIPLQGPKQSGTITFRAPAEPGAYTYLCSFPGHYLSGMKGVLLVR